MQRVCGTRSIQGDPGEIAAGSRVVGRRLGTRDHTGMDEPSTLDPGASVPPGPRKPGAA